MKSESFGVVSSTSSHLGAVSQVPETSASAVGTRVTLPTIAAPSTGVAIGKAIPNSITTPSIRYNILLISLLRLLFAGILNVCQNKKPTCFGSVSLLAQRRSSDQIITG